MTLDNPASDDNSFVVIDFETATSKRDSACALGAVLVKNHEIVDKFDELIRPPRNEYDDFNIGLHGITPDKTERAAPFHEVWLQLEEEMAADKLLLAHNANFDSSVAQQSAKQEVTSLVDHPLACTYQLSRKVWPNEASYRLCDLADEFGIHLNHHQALSDARAAAELAKFICHSLGVTTVPEAMAATDYSPGTLLTGVPPGESQRTRQTPGGPYSGRSRDPHDPDILRPVVFNLKEHPLYGKKLVFTGTLRRFTRRIAAGLIADCGASIATAVSNKVDYLVVGGTNFSVVKDGMSSKFRKAIQIAEAGHGLEIIDEEDFYSLLYDH